MNKDDALDMIVEEMEHKDESTFEPIPPEPKPEPELKVDEPEIEDSQGEPKKSFFNNLFKKKKSDTSEKKSKSGFTRMGRPRTDGQKYDYPTEMCELLVDNISDFLERVGGQKYKFTEKERKNFIKTGLPFMNKYLNIPESKVVEFDLSIVVIAYIGRLVPDVVRYIQSFITKKGNTNEQYDGNGIGKESHR